MGVRFEGVPPQANRNDVATQISRLVHHPPFPVDLSGQKLNFDVRLLLSSNPTKRVTGWQGTAQAHRGCGFLTFPDEALDLEFLRLAAHYPEVILVHGTRLRWSLARERDDPNLVHELRTTPWKDSAELERVSKDASVLRTPVEISGFAFGRMLRDGIFSVEEQRQNVLRPEVQFDGKRRSISLLSFNSHAPVVRIHVGSIQRIIADDKTFPCSIVLILSYPPSFQQYPEAEGPPRKLSAYDDGHARVAPFGLDLRLTLPNPVKVADFLLKACQLSVASSRIVHAPVKIQQQVLRYTPEALDKLNDWFESVDIELAFQLSLLLHNALLEPTEILQLKKWTDSWARNRLGVKGTAEVIRRFALRADELSDAEDEHGTVVKRKTLAGLIGPIKEDVLAERLGGKEIVALDAGSFSCFHAVQTPTSLFLSGPHVERSNRIIRQHIEHQTHFLRVNFRTEEHQRYMFDREVDFLEYLDRRIGRALKHEGIHVAGRKFDFVGYSNSSLKDHAAWFVTPFVEDGRTINATVIRGEMGSFEVESHFPARLGARMAQCFTSTEPSIILRTGELHHLDDIETNDSVHTDGVGTISPDLAVEIWSSLQRDGKAGKTRRREVPSAFQIRLGGMKGMVVVDHRLTGIQLNARPSMEKFDAPEHLDVEIAKAFTRAGGAFLNKPLIKILEDLGVPDHVFLDRQRLAIREIEACETDLTQAYTQLERYGLGRSFRISSILMRIELLLPGLSLADLTDLHPTTNESGSEVKASEAAGKTLLGTALQIATATVLRDLKFRARIPVQGYSLVGVADEWEMLAEGEIYACVTDLEGEPTWMKGSVLVTRSPTTHCGDARFLWAIGPPPGDLEDVVRPVRNCVVFSVQGERSVTSMMGGGDLDGDEFVIITDPELHPHESAIVEPAVYEPAIKWELQRPARIEHIAEHAVNFIANDILGMMSTRLMVIADVSALGMKDPHCVQLAALASHAVDFNKSGTPVSIDSLPRPRTSYRPDFNAREPDAALSHLPTEYYESKRILGQLYRNVQVPTPALTQTRQHPRWTPHRSSSTATGPPPTALHTALEALLHSLPTYFHPTPFTSPHSTQTPLATVAKKIASHFIAELLSIATFSTLSHRTGDKLTEAEVFLGSILAATSQPGVRRTAMIEMGERTRGIVGVAERGMRGAAEADVLERNAAASEREELLGSWVRVSWACWEEAEKRRREGEFGAEAFGWVVLGTLLDLVEEIKELVEDTAACKADSPWDVNGMREALE